MMTTVVIIKMLQRCLYSGWRLQKCFDGAIDSNYGNTAYATQVVNNTDDSDQDHVCRLTVDG